MDNKMLERIKTARTCILAFKADMQVQMTDDTEGDIYSAVPVTMVNQWFDILERQAKELSENNLLPEKEEE